MLELVPISLKEANAYVERYHRHHKPVVGHKFSIAAAVDGEIVGVAIVGRPVSRYLDDGWTLEVNRLCTNGYRNALFIFVTLVAKTWTKYTKSALTVHTRTATMQRQAVKSAASIMEG